ncbi:MAG TPA: AcvB/VirJ family lysyl-phosphatidylglycerol hydrolase [Gemmatimonadales bacterium]|nr:AcvB/VirJ family lysyl-phosphatidylglycerol hydrolase [Gemmatimonadales bacterium]
MSTGRTARAVFTALGLVAVTAAQARPIAAASGRPDGAVPGRPGAAEVRYPATGQSPGRDSTSLAALPLVVLRPARIRTDAFAILLSGDGGWANLDKQVAAYLTAHGIPVVGFNSLQYFWHRRTPEEIARDLGTIIRYYSAAWHLPGVALVGYSRGADVLPLMVSRLPDPLKAEVRLVALIGPELKASLEFHAQEWLGSPRQGYALLPEMEKLQGLPLLCIHGQQERESLCPRLPAGLAETVLLPGGHHFGGDYRGLGRLILARLDRSRLD